MKRDISAPVYVILIQHQLYGFVMLVSHKTKFSSM